MCSEFMIRTSTKVVERELGLVPGSLEDQLDWDLRVKLSLKAPILYADFEEQVKLDEAIFPVMPFPNSRLSSLPDSPQASSDPIVRIYDKKTWAQGFQQNRCLVPMTSFFEPAYWGEGAGSVMEFKSEKDPVLFVPAIRIKPIKPKTEKANAFSLLTHTASEQMLKYHHRLLVLLKPKNALEWIQGGKSDPVEKFDYLIKNRYVPKFAVQEDRKMAKGWNKRIEQHEAKLRDETEYRKTLKTEDIEG